MKQLYYSLCSMVVIIVFVFGSFSQVSAKSITGKFSDGGMQLTIKTPGNTFIEGLTIDYCDGTIGTFTPVPHVYRSSWVYFDTKEMRRVRAYTTNPDFDWETNPVQGIETEFKRKCNGDTPPPPLFCKNVEIVHTIHRGVNETITFKSTQSAYSAGLRLPGVDRLIWVETISWNYSLRREQNLEYDKATRIWSGTFPSLYIPVGDYKDVWLLVFDEFGQQAACKIGKLSILP